MGGAAKMTKFTQPAVAMPEPPTELRINAKKFPAFKNHKVGDKLNISGSAHVHSVSAGKSSFGGKDYHDVTLHIHSLEKGDKSNGRA